MPLFRNHRHTLEESLQTTVIIKNIDNLREVIYEDWKMWEGALRKNDDKPLSKDNFDIKVSPYFGECDYRCGWYTQIVSADLVVKGRFDAIGFLSEPLND